MIDKVDGTDAVAAPVSGWRMKLLELLKRFKGPVIAIASVGAVLSGLVGYWNVYRTVVVATPTSTAATAAPASAGDLSIVVLPFANQTGDPQKAYVADGLTTSVTLNLSHLSRVRDWYVVPAATALTYRDKALTVQQAAKEFGVRFVATGSVLNSGAKLRITAQLTDTLSGKQLWTKTLDHELGELVANLDGVAGTFHDDISHEMLVAVNREVERRKSSPTYAELMMRADIMGWDSDKREHLDKMESLFRQAVALEPPDKRSAKLGLAATLALILGAITSPRKAPERRPGPKPVTWCQRPRRSAPTLGGPTLSCIDTLVIMVTL